MPLTRQPSPIGQTAVSHTPDDPTVRVRFAKRGPLVTELLAVSGLVGTGLAGELAQRLRRLAP